MQKDFFIVFTNCRLSFKAKIHHIRFPLGFAPDPGEDLCSSQTIYLYLRGPTCKGRERKRRRDGKGQEGKGREGKKEGKER